MSEKTSAVKPELENEGGSAPNEQDKKGRDKSKRPMTRQERKAEREKRRQEQLKNNNKNKPKDIKKAAKRLIGYITRQKIWLFVVGALIILSTVVSVCVSLVMKPVYTAIEDVIIRNADPGAAMSSITKWLGIMAIAYVVSAFMCYLYTRIMLQVSVKTLTEIRKELFDHLQTLPISFFDKKKTGEIMSRFTSDVGRISDLITSSFQTLISSSVNAVMSISIMLIFSWKITLTISVAIVLMMAVVMLVTKKCSPLFKKQQETMGECNAFIEEYVRGIKAVKLFCYEEKAKQGFRDLNEKHRRIGVKANIISGTMRPIMSMITRINYAVTVSLGAVLVMQGQMTVPNLVTFLQFAGSYGTPIAQLASCYSSLVSALAGAERIFEILDTESETDEGKVRLAKAVSSAMGYTESEDGDELVWKVPTEDGGSTLTPVRCSVKIDSLSFSYVQDKPVLKGVSAEAKAGEKLAFVGSTGAGKTTITNLVNRFYEIDDGSITIDGIDIRDIKKHDLRSCMAFVLQESRLFVGTIADNIRYGRLDATDEEVIEAAKLANAHSFIEKLPDGYNSKIRADGVNLSAGQVQLLSIARAAISNRPLLVLDEATSSVDTRTERMIEKGMDSLMDGRTVLVIAHRLSTVRNSNEITVIENGEVIEHGSHEELIALGAKYYQLYTGSIEMK